MLKLVRSKNSPFPLLTKALAFSLLFSACTNKRGIERVPSGGNTEPVLDLEVPVVTAISPASPSNDETPQLMGSSDPDVTIQAYLGSDCSGSPIGSASAADFASGLLTVTFPSNSTSQFSVKSVASDGRASDCGYEASYSFTEDSIAPSAPSISSPASSPYTSNSSTYTANGTCETGATVFVSGDASGSTTCSGGTFSLASTKTVDGTYNFTYYQRDAAGNSSTTVTRQWVRNSSLPSNVVITVPATSPFYTNQNNVTISGTCTAGYTVRASNDHSEDVTCSGGGTFSFSVSKTSDATYSVNVVQINLASVSSGAETVQWTRDTSAPASLVISAPATSPHYSSANSLTISGSCENNATVYITGDLSSSTTCTSNAFSFASNKTSDATYNYTLYQSDLAGNNSPNSTQQWVRDTVAPSAPVVLVPASTPTSSALDDLVISGTCTAGLTVRISGDRSEDVTCSVGGTFSITDTQMDDDTYDYTLKQVDLAGNESSGVSISWIRDTVQPGPPVITTPAYSPYYSSGASFTLSGTCESGTTVNLSGDDTQSTSCTSSSFSFTVGESADGTYNYSVSQVDTAGNTSSSAAQSWVRDNISPADVAVTSPSDNPHYTTGNAVNISGTCEAGATVQTTGASTLSTTCDSGGNFNLSDTKSTNGTYTYNIRQVDLAGNASGYISLSWVRDNSTPSTPVITTPAASPYYSNSSPLTISGTCTTGYTVRLSGAATDSYTCASSAFTFSVSKGSEGTYNFSVLQESGAGTQSSSATLQWVLDQTAPAAPVVTNPGSSPYISNSDSFVVIGNCEIGATVHVTNAHTEDITCSTGTYTFTSTKTSDATYTYSIRQEDQAGNLSSIVTQQWQRLASIPATPVLSNPTSNPHFSNTNSLTISGSCVTGYAVTLDGASSQTTTCASSTFSFNVTASAEGTQSYTIWQTDTLDVDSGSVTLDWTYDATAPSAPTIVNPATSPYISGIGLTISGACEALATVILRRSTGTQLTTTSCNSGGTYSITWDEASDSTYNYQVYQRDRALNSSGNATLQWTRDSTIPATPVITTPASNPYQSGESVLTISGTCESSATVLLTGSATNSVTCSSSTFTFTINQAVDGNYSYTIKQQDLALNLSAAATLNWVRDAGSPTVTIDSQPSDPNYSAAATFTFSANESSTFECKLDGQSYTTCTSPLTYSTVTNGNRTFYVRARDTAGNYSAEDTYSWVQSGYNTIALYHFTNAGSEDFFDMSFFENDLTNSSSTLASGTGMFGDGRNLARASSQSIYAPYDNQSFSLSRSTMTIEAFVRFTSVPSSNNQIATIVSQSKINNACSSNCGWAMVIKRASNKNYFSFYGSTGGTSMTEIKFQRTFATNTWYHLAVTWNRGSVTMYIDGVSVKTGTIGTAGSSTLFESNQPLRIGGWDGSHFLDGRVDEVRWSNIVRTISVPGSEYSSD